MSLTDLPVTDAALDFFALCLALAPAALPGLIWMQWSFAPAIILPLGLMLVLYFGGLKRIGIENPGTPSIAFHAGWALLVVALVSPMCRLAGTLTSAHMAQVMILAIAAPFLMAVGRGWDMIGAGMQTGEASQEGLQNDAATAAARSRLPLTPIAILYGVTLWALHAPPVYDAILTDATMHIVSLFALVGISLAFWTSVLDAARVAPGRAVTVLFATMAHTGLLGAILTFAGTLLYPLQAAGALIWGLDPLADQQLAGLIMWVVGNGLYLAAGLWLAYGLMSQLGPEAEAER
jgi:cytochrome c oxidase assembly factor CtaG